jgi:hypothetical protein
VFFLHWIHLLTFAIYKKMEPTSGIEPEDLFLTKEALYRLSYVGKLDYIRIVLIEGLARSRRRTWSGRRGSNSRQSAWKAEALPTELLPPDL